jgi:hypothetical protein
VLWAIVAAGTLGLLFGFRFRVYAVFAISIVIVVAGIAAAPVGSGSALEYAITIVGMLVALQCGYVAGLLLLCGWSRLRLAARAKAPLLAGGEASSHTGVQF